MIVAPNATDVTVYFKLIDPTTGAPETGLTITNLDATYVRDRAAAVKADLTALGAVTDAHSDNQAIQVDATNAPGLYRVDFPDAAFASGVARVQLIVNGAAIDPAVIEVELAPWLTLVTGAGVLLGDAAITAIWAALRSANQTFGSIGKMLSDVYCKLLGREHFDKSTGVLTVTDPDTLATVSTRTVSETTSEVDVQ